MMLFSRFHQIKDTVSRVLILMLLSLSALHVQAQGCPSLLAQDFAIEMDGANLDCTTPATLRLLYQGSVAGFNLLSYEVAKTNDYVGALTASTARVREWTSIPLTGYNNGESVYIRVKARCAATDKFMSIELPVQIVQEHPYYDADLRFQTTPAGGCNAQNGTVSVRIGKCTGVTSVEYTLLKAGRRVARETTTTPYEYFRFANLTSGSYHVIAKATLSCVPTQTSPKYSNGLLTIEGDVAVADFNVTATPIDVVSACSGGVSVGVSRVDGASSVLYEVLQAGTQTVVQTNTSLGPSHSKTLTGIPPGDYTLRATIDCGAGQTLTRTVDFKIVAKSFGALTAVTLQQPLTTCQVGVIQAYMPGGNELAPITYRLSLGGVPVGTPQVAIDKPVLFENLGEGDYTVTAEACGNTQTATASLGKKTLGYMELNGTSSKTLCGVDNAISVVHKSVPAGHHLTVTLFSGSDIVRILPQSDNNRYEFSGLTAGGYTVEIKADCGERITQKIQVGHVSYGYGIDVPKQIIAKRKDNPCQLNTYPVQLKSSYELNYYRIIQGGNTVLPTTKMRTTEEVIWLAPGEYDVEYSPFCGYPVMKYHFTVKPRSVDVAVKVTGFSSSCNNRGGFEALLGSNAGGMLHYSLVKNGVEYTRGMIFPESNEYERKVSVSDLSPGIYTLKVYHECAPTEVKEEIIDLSESKPYGVIGQMYGSACSADGRFNFTPLQAGGTLDKSLLALYGNTPETYTYVLTAENGTEVDRQDDKPASYVYSPTNLRLGKYDLAVTMKTGCGTNTTHFPINLRATQGFPAVPYARTLATENAQACAGPTGKIRVKYDDALQPDGKVTYTLFKTECLSDQISLEYYDGNPLREGKLTYQCGYEGQKKTTEPLNTITVEHSTDMATFENLTTGFYYLYTTSECGLRQMERIEIKGSTPKFKVTAYPINAMCSNPAKVRFVITKEPDETTDLSDKKFSASVYSSTKGGTLTEVGSTEGEEGQTDITVPVSTPDNGFGFLGKVRYCGIDLPVTVPPDVTLNWNGNFSLSQDNGSMTRTIQANVKNIYFGETTTDVEVETRTLPVGTNVSYTVKHTGSGQEYGPFTSTAENGKAIIPNLGLGEYSITSVYSSACINGSATGTFKVEHAQIYPNILTSPSTCASDGVLKVKLNEAARNFSSVVFKLNAYDITREISITNPLEEVKFEGLPPRSYTLTIEATVLQNGQLHTETITRSAYVSGNYIAFNLGAETQSYTLPWKKGALRFKGEMGSITPEMTITAAPATFTEPLPYTVPANAIHWITTGERVHYTNEIFPPGDYTVKFDNGCEAQTLSLKINLLTPSAAPILRLTETEFCGESTPEIRVSGLDDNQHYYSTRIYPLAIYSVRNIWHSTTSLQSCTFYRQAYNEPSIQVPMAVTGIYGQYTVQDLECAIAPIGTSVQNVSPHSWKELRPYSIWSRLFVANPLNGYEVYCRFKEFPNVVSHWTRPAHTIPNTPDYFYHYNQGDVCDNKTRCVTVAPKSCHPLTAKLINRDTGVTVVDTETVPESGVNYSLDPNINYRLIVTINGVQEVKDLSKPQQPQPIALTPRVNSSLRSCKAPYVLSISHFFNAAGCSNKRYYSIYEKIGNTIGPLLERTPEPVTGYTTSYPYQPGRTYRVVASATLAGAGAAHTDISLPAITNYVITASGVAPDMQFLLYTQVGGQAYYVWMSPIKMILQLSNGRKVHQIVRMDTTTPFRMSNSYSGLVWLSRSEWLDESNNPTTITPEEYGTVTLSAETDCGTVTPYTFNWQPSTPTPCTKFLDIEVEEQPLNDCVGATVPVKLTGRAFYTQNGVRKTINYTKIWSNNQGRMYNSGEIIYMNGRHRFTFQTQYLSGDLLPTTCSYSGELTRWPQPIPSVLPSDTYGFFCDANGVGNLYIGLKGGKPPYTYKLYRKNADGTKTFIEQKRENGTAFFQYGEKGVTYHFEATDDCGNRTIYQDVTVDPLASITYTTENTKTVREGESHTLVAQSRPFAQYKWTRNGVQIGTDRLYTVTNAQMSDAGQYQSSIKTTACASNLETGYTLHVLRLAEVSGTQTRSLCSGGSITLNIGAPTAILDNSPVTPTYKWRYRRPEAGGTWADYPSATSETFVFSPTSLHEGAWEFCRVSTVNGFSETSGIVEVQVNPGITQNVSPSELDLTVQRKLPYTLTAGLVTTTGEKTYEWERSTNQVNWSLVGTGQVYTEVKAPANKVVYYRRRTKVAGGACSVLSPVIKVRIIGVTTPPYVNPHLRLRVQ